MKAKYYFKCRMEVDTSVRTSVETRNATPHASANFDKWVNLSAETSKCSLILINRCSAWNFLINVLTLMVIFKQHTGKFFDVKSCTNYQRVYSIIESSYYVYWDAWLWRCRPQSPMQTVNFLWQTLFARVDKTILSICLLQMSLLIKLAYHFHLPQKIGCVNLLL